MLGNPDIPHTLTYLPDFGRALVTLGTREEALGHVWHVPSAETLTSRAFAALVFEALGRPLKLQVTPSALWPSLRCSARRCVPSGSSGISATHRGSSTTRSSPERLAPT